MDKINFYSGNKFPLYRSALAKIQDAIFAVSQLTALGGKTYILSGCEVANNMVSEGIVVINGELLPFVGGAAQSRVAITESRQSVDAFGVTYPEVYITRQVIFSAKGEYDWSNFAPIQSNAALYDLIKNIKGDAPGTVKMWAGAVVKIPVDYKLCNGDELPVAEYAELFDNIGIAFGGNGQTSFRLPDLRDRFIVGYNSSENSDYNVIGRKGGAKDVILTTAQIPAHNHADSMYFNKLSARAADVDATNTPGSVDDKTADAEYRVGGMSATQWADATIKSVGENKPHENRPPWIALAYIIKVK